MSESPKIIGIDYALDDRHPYFKLRRGGVFSHASQLIGDDSRSILKSWLAAIKVGIKQDYEVVCVLSAGHGCMSRPNAYLKKIKWVISMWVRNLLIRFLLRDNDKKLIVIDLVDDTTIAPIDSFLAKRCSLYYKRELCIDVIGSLERISPWWQHYGMAFNDSWYKKIAPNLRPISLGIIEIPKLESYEREYDVFYVGNNRGFHRQRLAVEKALKILHLEHGVKVYHPNKRLSKEDYWRALYSSKVSISPSGVGWDCFRHYEVAAAKTALCISRPTIIASKPFLDGEECLYWDDVEDLVHSVLALLSDDDKRDAMVDKAYSKVTQQHTYEIIKEDINQDVSRLLNK